MGNKQHKLDASGWVAEMKKLQRTHHQLQRQIDKPMLHLKQPVVGSDEIHSDAGALTGHLLEIDYTSVKPFRVDNRWFRFCTPASTSSNHLL